MRSQWPALGAKLLSILAVLPLQPVHAIVPSVNVGLKASFNSPPYLIELLETAAEENSTAYLPLLDRIADGAFPSTLTEEQLYNKFLKILVSDGHITDPETLASFKFALSIHSATPRIEAHYQFYETSVLPSIVSEEGKKCENWVASKGRQHCAPDFYETMGELRATENYKLPFDRPLGDKSPVMTILYADLTSPGFANFHKILGRIAHEGKMSYRIRYKPTRRKNTNPLMVSGYGVELALKKTDYIVIDDRQKDETNTEDNEKTGDGSLKDEEIADIKPLATSELAELGMNAASFVMNSQDPLDTLLKLSQDFPKHSTAVATHNASKEFIIEQIGNAGTMPPHARNVLWINGLQVESRHVNAFSLLEHFRRERRLISHFRALGLTGTEAVDLLSHEAIAEAHTGDDTQRYDWRDDIEGGNVIMWMNDIEKDKRYFDWPSSLDALLQRTFPGQLPPVKRDIHNVVLAVDFSNEDNVGVVVDMIQSLIRRKVPIRWGLVPIVKTPAAIKQAQIAYHIVETYGLGAFMGHLMNCVNQKKFDGTDQALFDLSTTGHERRQEKEQLTLQQVLEAESNEARIGAANMYLTRLGADGPSPPIFVNGIPIKNDDDWLQSMSSRVSLDLRSVQRAVYEEIMPDDEWVPNMFLIQSSATRNPLVIPDDEKSIKVVDLGKVWQNHGSLLGNLPLAPAADDADKADWSQMIVVADFDSLSGMQIFKETTDFLNKHPGIETSFLHNEATVQGEHKKLSTALYKWTQDEQKSSFQEAVVSALDETSPDASPEAVSFWKQYEAVLETFGLGKGKAAVIFNGRIVGPIPVTKAFSMQDFETMLSYEGRKRMRPVQHAAEELGLLNKIASPLVAGKLYSMVATSTVSDLPEGIFESLPSVRISTYNTWNSSHTILEKGDRASATFQLVAAVDPVSENAQRWIPILKVLSELDGVYLRIFLNPQRTLSELPVKRFYRYVLEPRPSFGADGKLKSPEAEFTGMPAEALLTAGMDVPPSWLVSPKDSVHDLDNIKLSLRKTSDAIKATYEIEHILIEGHSREKTNVAPRGAQLRIGTESNPHIADTLIMANLGYFQFKVNPGFYKIALLEGRSDEIFQIDSAGNKGYHPTLGDENTEVALMSFQGLTLFPRISRKPGMEEEDVLTPATSAAEDFASMGTEVADQILSKVGLGNVKAADLLSEGSKFLSSLASKAGLSSTAKVTSPAGRHAEVNIFSVASGHLYERMLNIMMVSVMKHTKHSVKFWFIEQFLSPSFRESLPHVADEYGFTYEMVTFKWPHWLRGQREKQREIWGYKILFLDVLFPLDLDRVIFVDADQVVRTDMHELATLDLHGAPYGFTPMCDSREEMEGFRFWKQGYWKNFLRGLPYHISALYVVDLARFRALAAGDRLRQHYQQLSADPGSLANLDQDLPNSMQLQLPIFSLPQDWLWCETWCSDEALATAKTIDLCNNPMTKEPKLDRARRQLPEWTEYDDEIAELIWRKTGGTGYESARVDGDPNRVFEPHDPLPHTGGPFSEDDRVPIKDEL